MTIKPPPIEIFNRINIYLFDEILKGRYFKGQTILEHIGLDEGIGWYLK